MEKSELDLDERRARPLGRGQGPRALTHGLHYGTGVFEGIRCYETDDGPAIFRHRDHLARLEKSAELYYLPLPYSAEELREATHELIRRQRARELLHPPARVPRLRRDGPLREERAGRRHDRRLALGRLPRRRGQAARRSAPRSPPGGGSRRTALIPHAKASGQYLNSILAKTEAANAGYDEAILLDQRGIVCEGSGENIFVVRDGEHLHAAARRRDPRRDQRASR